jgi:hypothetical protein
MTTIVVKGHGELVDHGLGKPVLSARSAGPMAASFSSRTSVPSLRVVVHDEEPEA